jgi:hypothetical protein
MTYHAGLAVTHASQQTHVDDQQALSLDPPKFDCHRRINHKIQRNAPGLLLLLQRRHQTDAVLHLPSQGKVQLRLIPVTLVELRLRPITDLSVCIPHAQLTAFLVVNSDPVGQARPTLGLLLRRKHHVRCRNISTRRNPPRLASPHAVLHGRLACAQALSVP